MDCNHVEDLLSAYIENDLPATQRREISGHLEECRDCRLLKEQMEEMMNSFSILEEDVPFHLKNRLLYIHESQELAAENDRPARYEYLNWAAAMVGTIVLFLNLFYFTNLYPPANRALHTVVSRIEVIAVETEAFFEKVKDSKDMLFSSLLQKETGENDVPEDENIIKKNGGKNG